MPRAPSKGVARPFGSGAAGGCMFGELLVRWNRLDGVGFTAWEFLPGMRFGEHWAWWRDGALRDTPHEGLDILYYRGAGESRGSLGPGARVPPIGPGGVVAIVRDFLGASVFVAHDDADERGWRLHSVYGHVAPRAGLAVGERLRAREEVGTIADPSGRRTSVPPHLHLTLALIACADGPADLGWDVLRDRARTTLLDPLPVLCRPSPSGPAGRTY